MKRRKCKDCFWYAEGDVPRSASCQLCTRNPDLTDNWDIGG